MRSRKGKRKVVLVFSYTNRNKFHRPRTEKNYLFVCILVSLYYELQPNQVLYSKSSENCRTTFNKWILGCETLGSAEPHLSTGGVNESRNKNRTHNGYVVKSSPIQFHCPFIYLSSFVRNIFFTIRISSFIVAVYW